MMPALWIAKTGLDAQQTNISVISNNLANSSTIGFKKGRPVFEYLLYQKINQPGGRSSAESELPTGLMIGVGAKVMSTQKTFTQGDVQTTDNALDLMIKNGADVNGIDSHGNSGIWRFCLQSNQVLPSFNYVDHVESDDRLFTDELHEDLRRILTALKEAGADPRYAAPNFGKCPLEFYTEGSLSIILKEVFG